MDILSDLNPQQQAAVIYEGGPLLILAGAGSGKTRVLTYRVAHFISTGVLPENILLLTFTNKAAEEMMRRVSTILGTKSTVVGGTFHSFCVKVLRKFALEAELDPNFVIFDVSDQLDTIKECMAALGADPKTQKPSSILNVISSAKNDLIDPYQFAEYARSNSSMTIAKIYLAYQQRLKKYQALDFDDLLFATVRLLKSSPETLEKLHQQFSHILVDEYQDTNKSQYEITKLLAKKTHQITVVGDAAQAIYSWRGADYKNMLLLKQDFPDLETINLEQNYRSTQTILDAAYAVVSHNKNHPILKLWTGRESGAKITLYEADNEQDEARYVVQNITGNYKDYAVLYRTNAQSRVLEEVFLHHNVPYVLVGGVRFYERKEVKDVLAYLQLVINPANEVAYKRAEKIGKTRLRNLLNTEIKVQDTLAILDEVMRVTGYLEIFDPHDEEDLARLENIKELRSVAERFSELVEFLTQIALTEKESRKTKVTEAGAVTLMTMHSAKGLEFKTVFMVGLEEGLFPHSRTLMDPSEMEEERRLAYVGVTRAMDKLYLTYARRRLYFGQSNTNPVSRFVSEIPETLLDIKQNELQSFFPRPKKPQSLTGTGWGFDDTGAFVWKPDEELPF